MKCPGQDMQFWKPGDIFDVPCPECGNMVEFFKDESSKRCKKCGLRFKNPRLDLGCLEWCKYADQCRAGMDDFTPEDPWKQAEAKKPNEEVRK